MWAVGCKRVLVICFTFWYDLMIQICTISLSFVKDGSQEAHWTHLAVADSCIFAEIGNFLIFCTARSATATAGCLKCSLCELSLRMVTGLLILISILIFAFPDFIVTEWIGKMGVKVWGDPNRWQMTFFTVQTKPFKLPPIKIDTGSLFRMNTFADCISCVMYDIGGFCIFTHDRDCITV